MTGDTPLIDILNKLGNAKDMLALVERAAEADQDSPLVMGCGLVGEFVDEAVALVEALRKGETA